MNAVKGYDIPFKGLSEGFHSFTFELHDNFFAGFENSEIKGGSAVAEVGLEKGGNMLSLDFHITGTVSVECDRCLEECPVPVDYSGQLIVRFSESEDGLYDGEIMWLSPRESELNVAQYIYESIVLSLPLQRVHSDDENGTPGCNPDMLERFVIVTGEQQEEENGDGINPQLEKLRELKDKL